LVARSRGSKIGIGLLVLLVILVGVFVVVDRIGVSAAEDQIAKQAQKELVARKVSASEPKVAIAGFPFLTQVVAGKYKKITIDIDQPKIQDVQLDRLNVVATTVRADAQSVLKGTGNVVADHIIGTATIGWAHVQQILKVRGLPEGIDVSKVDLKVANNAITLSFPVSYQGINLTVIAKGTLLVEKGAVKVQLNDVGTDQGAAPELVQNLIRQYKDRLNVVVAIPQMPFKLVIDKIESSGAGLLMIASASNVVLSGDQ
jgi:hypothetical protein